jgi:hypothetical protein
MISPDYFDFRLNCYRPILDRLEQPSDRCKVEVRRLPIRDSGQDAGDYIPYAIDVMVTRTISASLRRLQDYAIRYMVRGERVSAHSLPRMNADMREIVTYLRQQNPHLSRNLLHHWGADPHGATALLQVCETLWKQGWKQEQIDDGAPWVPAVNVLLLKLIRDAAASLPDEEEEITNHVMLSVVGGLYLWALQVFLKEHLEGMEETRRTAYYESIILPVTPMAFLHHQPDTTLLADDGPVIRIYGLEPEIVSQFRFLKARGSMKNEGGILAVLAKDKLGVYLLRRTWVRLSLWKLAIQTGHGAWMRWVMDAKRMDQLLAGQGRPDAASIDNLKAFRNEPVAAWLLAQMEGKRAQQKAGEPWLDDDITLKAFQVFDEDVKVEVARRQAEHSWKDKMPELGSTRKASGSSGLSETHGLRGAHGSAIDIKHEKAWKDGELVLIQFDVTKALHSGKAVPLNHGCLRIEWSDYLVHMHAVSIPGSNDYLTTEFLPGVLAIVEKHDGLFLDECSASGCLLRGPVLGLLNVGIELRHEMRGWCLRKYAGVDDDEERNNLPVLSMCLDISGDWSYAEQKHMKFGYIRMAFALAVARVDAGVTRDASIGRLMDARDSKLGLKPVGGVRVETVASGTGQTVQMLHNTGFILTATAVAGLATVLANKASFRDYRPQEKQVKGVLDGCRMPQAGLDLLVIERNSIENELPWLLMKVGKPCLAGTDVEIFELLDADSDSATQIVSLGLSQWMSK